MSKSTSTLKIKTGSPDLTDRMLRRLNRDNSKPSESGVHVATRSKESSPSFIRYVVTTGIRPFDDRVGGMPVGKTIELFGLPSSGKTAMAVRTCVRAQRGFIYERVKTKEGYELRQLKPGTFNVTILYYDNEGSLSDDEKRTVDGVMMDGIIEQCDTVDLLWKTMETVVDMADEEEKETGIIQFVVVVIDTVASTSTTEQLKSAWGKRDFPRSPAQLKGGFQIMIRKLQRENVLLIGTNHVSKRMDIRPGRTAFTAYSYAAPGGQAFAYYSVHRIFFEYIQTNYRLTKTGNPAGFLIYFFSYKNRLLPPLRSGRISLLFGDRDEKTGEVYMEGGLHDVFSVLETLIYSKAAEISKESGAISFKFAKFGITTTTFGEKTKSLEEQDDEAEVPPAEAAAPGGRRGRGREPAVEEAAPLRKRDPKMNSRAAWQLFYKEHRTDLDALYAEANRQCFLTEGTRPDFSGQLDEDEDNGEAEEDTSEDVD